MKYQKAKDEYVNDMCYLVKWSTMVGGTTMEDHPVYAFVGNIFQGVICTNEYHKVLLHPFMEYVGILCHRQDNYILNGWLNHIMILHILLLPNIGKVYDKII